MSDWHKVAVASEIPPGSSREIVVGGRIVALFNIDGRFHAIDGICAHQGGPLAKGAINGCVVTCPWHGWQYDVTSGHHCLNPRINQTLFDVKIEGQDVLVRV